MRVRFGGLSLCLLGACTPAAAPVTARATASSTASSGPSPASPAPTADLTGLLSFDALAARGPSLARGMREVTRGELSSGASSSVLLVRAEASDACVRVAIVASSTASPVRASLTDARGTVLADLPAITDASLGPRGPACVRKGEVVSLHCSGSEPWTARFVAWSSP